MISANGGLPAHRYTPQVTQRWPRGSEPASALHGGVQVCGSGRLAILPTFPNLSLGIRLALCALHFCVIWRSLPFGRHSVWALPQRLRCAVHSMHFSSGVPCPAAIHVFARPKRGRLVKCVSLSPIPALAFWVV